MTIHTLEKEKHSDFLAQNRIDPITGDILQEGNKVVICASCKSAFLADSWEYMGRRHCEQNITLQEVPRAEVFKLDKNSFQMGYLNVELLEDKMVLKAHEGVFSGIAILINIILLTLSFSSFYLFAAYFIGLGIGKLKYSYFNSYSKTLEVENKSLIIDQGLKTERRFPVTAIESVESGINSPYSHLLSLGIYKASCPTNDFRIRLWGKGEHKTYKFLIEEKKLKRFEREHQLLTKLNGIAKENVDKDRIKRFERTSQNWIEQL